MCPPIGSPKNISHLSSTFLPFFWFKIHFPNRMKIYPFCIFWRFYAREELLNNASLNLKSYFQRKQINPLIFMCVAIKSALKVSSFTFKIKIDIHIFSKSWRVIIPISLSVSKCLQYIIRLEKNVFNPFYLRLPCCIRDLKQVLLKQNSLKGNDYGVLKII